jgi:hypothetical protein
MYKAIHGAVNAVLHVFITMPIWTSNRCSYAKKTSDHTYTELEVKMMCVSDLSAISSILRGTFNSFGLFVDNFLDVALVVVETAVTGKAPTCAHPSVQTVHSADSPRSQPQSDRTRRVRESWRSTGQCAGLAHLNLCGNNIGPDGAEFLGGVLPQYVSLDHLNLYNNDIGAAGAESLAGVLAQCPALAHLDLGSNQFGEAGAGRLA